MVISYDNLIVRLWLNGAIMPHSQLAGIDKASIDTMVDEQGLPPAVSSIFRRQPDGRKSPSTIELTQSDR
jgi:hypothetical protein